jgi:DNA-binding MarR family transcriptional regulator
MVSLTDGDGAPPTNTHDPRAGVLDQVVGYHLRRAFAAMAADFAEAMQGTGLRQVLFGILSVIARNPGTNQGMVGKVLGIKRANMVALINELVERGLLSRIADPQDRRAFSLTLTAAGAALLEEGLSRIRAHEDLMLAHIAEGDRARLVRILRKIAARAPPAE